MNKKIDVALLNARQSDYETMVREAKWLESLAKKGKSVENIEKDVKEFLNFGDDESVIDKADDRIIEYNLLKNSLIKLNNLTRELLSDKLVSEEEADVLNTIENRLADKVKSIFNIEEHILYKDLVKENV